MNKTHWKRHRKELGYGMKGYVIAGDILEKAQKGI